MTSELDRDKQHVSHHLVQLLFIYLEILAQFFPGFRSLCISEVTGLSSIKDLADYVIFL